MVYLNEYSSMGTWIWIQHTWYKALVYQKVHVWGELHQQFGVPKHRVFPEIPVQSRLDRDQAGTLEMMKGHKSTLRIKIDSKEVKR